MSDDPKRLLEGGSDATETERDLLRSAGEVEPAAGAQASMWAALATRLPPPGGGAPPGGGSAGGAGGAGGTAIGAKAAAVGLIGVVVAIGAVVLMRSSGGSEPAPPSSQASAVVVVTPALPPIATATAATATATAATAATAALEVPPEPAATATAKEIVTGPASSGPRLTPGRAPSPSIASGASGSTGTAMSPTDALRDEIALVAAARAALRRGDGPAALASLDTARKQHPRGALLQEREVLAIEALAQSGDTQGASRRATAFLRAFPTSPHASHVRTFER